MQRFSSFAYREIKMPFADLYQVDFDKDLLCALTPRERYVFALSGHVFNEVMTLQKLVIASSPKSEPHRFEQEGRVGLAVFLLKMMVGKVHEAMDMLTRHSVATILADKYFAPIEGLQARWDAAVMRYESLEWLRKIRNTASFHYMTAGQWKALSEEDLCTGAHAIVGKLYSQTFFHWHDAAAAFPMMRIVNESEPFEGLGTMLEELGELGGDLCECLAMGLQRYIGDHLMGSNAIGPVEEVPCEFIEKAEVRYFHANREE